MEEERGQGDIKGILCSFLGVITVVLKKNSSTYHTKQCLDKDPENVFCRQKKQRLLVQGSISQGSAGYKRKHLSYFMVKEV